MGFLLLFLAAGVEIIFLSPEKLHTSVLPFYTISLKMLGEWKFHSSFYALEIKKDGRLNKDGRKQGRDRIIVYLIRLCVLLSVVVLISKCINLDAQEQ